MLSDVKAILSHDMRTLQLNWMQRDTLGLIVVFMIEYAKYTNLLFWTTVKPKLRGIS